MKKHLLPVLILTFSTYRIGTAQTVSSHDSYVRDAARSREHPVDMQKMVLNVKFEPKEGKVIGSVTHEFVPIQQYVDSIYFDAPGITINKATLEQVITHEKGTKKRKKGDYPKNPEVLPDYIIKLKVVKFSTDKGGIMVYTPGMDWKTRYRIRFEYEATPKRGIYFMGWNEPTAETKLAEWGHVRNQIWTQGQGIDNRHWIPCYDESNDKLITETYITFNKNYKVLSNGLMLDKKENIADNTTTWHYTMSQPHASYLLMIAIDKYEVKSTKSARGVPVNFWYYPEFATDRLEPSSIYTEQMVDFMEEELGVNYPWESYSQVMVQDFIYGAMENTTATIFGDFFYVDKRAFLERNYIGVNMHEFTHQWFGDYVTARHGRDTWLQESFATHYPKYFFRSIYGEDFFQWQRRGELTQILDAEKKDRLPITNSQSGTARVYPKGSATLDMLRLVLGNEQYRKVIKQYLEKHSYRNVETNDLELAVHECLGLNLDWFFDQWLYRGGVPHYQVKWEKIGSNTRIYINQIQTVDDVVGYFKMPVVVQVVYADGSLDSKRILNEGKNQMIDIPNTGSMQVAYVLFDPNSQIIKNLTFVRTYKELEAQAKLSTNMMDRYDAILALRDTAADTKRELLMNRFQMETFQSIKVEIVNQLAKDSDPKIIPFVNDALSDADVNVRMAALNAIDKMSDLRRQLVEKMLTDSAYGIVEKALDKLCTQFPQNTDKYLDITKNDLGMGNSSRMKWLEVAIRSGQKQYVPTLIRFAGSEFEFRTRINAFASIKALNHLDDATCKALFSAILSWNGRLATPAAETLNYLTQQAAHRSTATKTYAAMPDAQRTELAGKGVKF